MTRTHSIEWSPQARQDVLNTHSYFEEFSPHAATEFAAAMRKSLQLLEELPRLGSPMTNVPLPGNFHSLLVAKKYRLIYRIEGERLIIYRVWDCRRDPSGMWDKPQK